MVVRRVLGRALGLALGRAPVRVLARHRAGPSLVRRVVLGACRVLGSAVGLHPERGVGGWASDCPHSPRRFSGNLCPAASTRVS